MEDVKNRRPHVETLGTNNFKHHLRVGTLQKEVCMKAFLGIYGIIVKRIRRIRVSKLSDKTQEDRRGKMSDIALLLKLIVPDSCG